MINPWRRIRKIAQLPTAKLAPETVLAQMLEQTRAGHIKSVVVSVMYADNDCAATWSNMELRDLAFHAVNLQRKVAVELAGASGSDG